MKNRKKQLTLVIIYSIIAVTLIVCIVMTALDKNRPWWLSLITGAVLGIDFSNLKTSYKLYKKMNLKYKKERMSKDVATNITLRLLNGDRCSNCEFYSVEFNEDFSRLDRCNRVKLKENPEDHICDNWSEADAEKKKLYDKRKSLLEILK